MNEVARVCFIKYRMKRVKTPYCATKYDTSFGFNHFIMRIDIIQASVHSGVITLLSKKITRLRMQLLNFIILYE